MNLHSKFGPILLNPDRVLQGMYLRLYNAQAGMCSANNVINGCGCDLVVLHIPA